MEMEIRKRSSLLTWLLVSSLVLHIFIPLVVSRPLVDDSKHSCGCKTPSRHGGGSYTPPSHGGAGSGGYTPIPNPPSHGGGVGGYTPTPVPKSPPYDPPSHGGSGSGYTPTPVPKPPAQGCTTPSTPSHGGGGSGGGYHSPPTATTPVINPPSPVTIDPLPPPTPVTPIVLPPVPYLPRPPVDPSTSPLYPAPCTYWSTHPAVIWGLFGYWGTVGGFFGAAAGSYLGGADPTLIQALTNPRTDAIGELYREGTAAFLNSMVAKKFPFTTPQVKVAFVAALGSGKTAASQAKVFKMANEGHMLN